LILKTKGKTLTVKVSSSKAQKHHGKANFKSEKHSQI